jgi:hypothetical protein
MIKKIPNKRYKMGGSVAELVAYMPTDPKIGGSNPGMA